MSLLQGKSILSQDDIDALGSSILTGTSVFNSTIGKYQIYVDSVWQTVSFSSDKKTLWIGWKTASQTFSSWGTLGTLTEEKSQTNGGTWTYPTDNSTNNYFSVPEDGFYAIHWDCSFTGTANNIAITINEPTIGNDTLLYGANNSDQTRVSTSSGFYVTTTDKIRLNIFNTTSPTDSNPYARIDVFIYKVSD